MNVLAKHRRRHRDPRRGSICKADVLRIRIRPICVRRLHAASLSVYSADVTAIALEIPTCPSRQGVTHKGPSHSQPRFLTRSTILRGGKLGTSEDRVLGELWLIGNESNGSAFRPRAE